MAKFKKSTTKVDGGTLRALAKAGFGTPMKGSRGQVTLAMTVANMNASDEEEVRELGDWETIAGRRTREACAEYPIDVSALAYDILARGAAVSYGIGPSPRMPIPRRGRDRSCAADCRKEASGALACLEGINVVGDDLAAAALLSATARACVVPDGQYDEAGSIAALARLCARMLADGEKGRFAEFSAAMERERRSAEG